MPRGFFSPEEDALLEDVNSVFWDCLRGHVRDDCRDEPPRSILDVGCHHGGLLSRLVEDWSPQRAWGIEPLAEARDRAAARLVGRAEDVKIIDTADWQDVPPTSFELVTGHEMLYLEPDLVDFLARIRRALTRRGRIYLVLGCHAENPVWTHWKPLLEGLGHRVYDHQPMDILAAGAATGLLPSVRPLRHQGWVTHDPRQGEFGFPSVSTMLDHHFKQKLLFRFITA